MTSYGCVPWNFPKCFRKTIVKHTCQKQPPEVFYKKDVQKNYINFKGKHLCKNLCFKRVAGWRPTTLLKNIILFFLCFPVNFGKPLRATFYRTPPDFCF